MVNSFRDWGRDCWCDSGVDDTCKHRFSQQFGELPYGYDHKYVYSHFGYNLKSTDMQASVGCAQLKKLPLFVEERKKNSIKKCCWKSWDWYMMTLRLWELYRTNPSWFGFLMTVRDDAGFTRDEITQYLENKNIQTRNLFSGNYIKHPCFDEMRASGKGYRVVGNLENTERILRDTFWVGVYPGMNDEMIDFMAKTIREAVR